MNRPFVITLGDPSGIGPEIIAKAFRDAPQATAGCFVAGDVATLRRAAACITAPGAVGLPVAEIEEPDDAVLEGVLRKLFRERHIRPADDLFPYLLRRIERSIPQAREVVARLDDAGDAAGRPITRALAREVLEDVQGDLLD